MPFVKVQKNNTYFKRFQVKFRRRREGKTDYYQRKRLTVQRKNKYNTPKWRFVVRRTNQRIICQVVYSTIAGDKIKASADSFELRRFGLSVGLTNYSAAYCTGLLTARRLLTVLDQENKARNITSSMAKDFNLVPETTGEYINIQEAAEKKGIEQRPFVCFLDLGLARATKGNRVFSAMKGAVDGGIHIPHSDKIFPSSGDAKKGGKSLLRERIFGHHVQTWIDILKNEKNTTQCKKWQKCLTDNKVKNTEELYKKVHAAIRASPARPNKQKKAVENKRDPKNPQVVISNGKRYTRNVRLSNSQRKERVQEKIRKYIQERKK